MSLSCVGNTPGLDFYFLSLCDHKELRALQGVSKQWRALAGNDQLWRNLFKLCFPGDMLQKTRSKEAFRKRLTPVCLYSTEMLDDAIKPFLCCLKWNSKRAFVCSFPGEFYSLAIEQGFGPKQGTQEGFQVAPDEVEYFQFIGELEPNLRAKAFFDENLTQCPREKGIPLCVRYHGIAADQRGSIYCCLRGSASYNKYSLIPRSFGVSSLHAANCITDCVEGVDVGYGNTLGYCSEINDWKSPFKLHCITEESGKLIWTGLFPLNRLFKFVTIDSHGKIKWEKIKDNRDIGHFSGCASLKQSYTETPIKF
jgi:hypothetical protein